MKLMIIVLNKPDKLDKVISALVEAGVPGGTLVQSEGIGQVLAADIPLFAGFKQMLSGTRPFNHMIFSVVSNDEVVADARTIINDVLGESDSHDGILFTLPVDSFAMLGKPRPQP